MKYSGGWSFAEAYSLPVGLRQWFSERLAKQLQAEREAIENAKKGNNGKTQTLSAFNQPSFSGPGGPT
ncbi:MAG: hypothetical protein CMF52_03275 [Legionellales bacterium]|nr:hypothetical protein [Legionellales bacterium]